MLKLQTTSSIQTKKIAKELALSLPKGPNKNKHALVITLHGNLGAGKTTFIQGFLRGLGIKSKITSPTFVIFKTYKAKGYKIFHFDCYRIKSAKEILDLNWKEIITPPAGGPKNIILIEWPERILKIIPKNIPPHQFNKKISVRKKIKGEAGSEDYVRVIKKYFKNWCGGKIKINFKHGKKENERELTLR